MRVSNYTKGAILFAAIYMLVLVLSIGLTNVRTSVAQSNPSVANTIITGQATSSASTFNLSVLVIEMLVVTFIAIAEMRFKMVSRIIALMRDWLKDLHPHLLLLMKGFILVGLDFLVYTQFGLAWWLFLTINGGGVLLVSALLLRKVGIRQLLPVAIVFISFFVIWPYILLFTINNVVLVLFTEFIYLPLVFLISVLIMRNPTQNRMNATAFSFSVLLPLTIGALFTPFWAIILLAIFSAYDFIAVFMTKHMQFMAQKLVSMNVPEVFMIGDVEAVQARIKSLETGENPEKALKGLERPLIFGAGDAILPSIVISSFVYFNLPVYALGVAIGCIIGVILNLMVLQRLKRVLPALPLILAGVLMSMSAVFLLLLL